MMSFGTLEYFESIIKKLKKIIVLYQPRDLYLCSLLVQTLWIYCCVDMSLAALYAAAMCRKRNDR